MPPTPEYAECRRRNNEIGMEILKEAKGVLVVNEWQLRTECDCGMAIGVTSISQIFSKLPWPMTINDTREIVRHQSASGIGVSDKLITIKLKY
jgi:hypothetical protein